jgi:leader peptidase (prepilin peptidase)/N-methyltransferase
MWIIDLFVIVFGLVLGSFLNVVAMRLLEGKSLVYPPSHCPRCKHLLGVFDLIPVLSYLFLLGKCRYCKNAISPLYPGGEGLTALSIYLVYGKLGLCAELVVGWVLASLLILAVLTDLKAKLILDRITFPFLGLLLVLRLFIGTEPWWWYWLGGVMGAGLLLLVAWLSQGGMGGGDVKLYLAIGVALGPWLTLLSIGLASLAGAVFGGILMLIGRIQRRQPVPFAPFIWLGTLVAYLFGTELWDGYMQL